MHTAELASQQIPHIVWSSKFIYRVHKIPPLVPILSQLHPLHPFLPDFPEINSNIIFPSMPRSSDWSLPFRFSGLNFVCISQLSLLSTCSTHVILLDLITLLICGEAYKLWSSLLCSLMVQTKYFQRKTENSEKRSFLWKFRYLELQYTFITSFRPDIQ